MRTAVSRTLLGIAISGLVIVPALSAAAAGPGAIRGARFTFSASSPRAAATGKGVLGGSQPLGGTALVRVVVPGASGRRTTVGASGRSWRLTSGAATTRLDLKIQIRSTSDPAVCPVGAHGLVEIVDGDPVDSVRISFADGRCRRFARSWAGQGSAASTRVSIEVLRKSG